MPKQAVVKSEEEEIVLTSSTMADLSPGPSTPWTPGISKIMTSEHLSPGDRRRAVLVELGVRRPRKRYKSKKARKEAAKKRREERKADRAAIYEQYGIKPRQRGPKLTDEQKKAKRSERGKKRRALLREMARANPELAKQFGVDPDRFRL